MSAAAAVLAAAGMAVLLLVLNRGLARSSVFPEAVTALRPMVESRARAEGIRNYTDDLLAIMTVETGGELKDVMQASESLDQDLNTLGTEESITQGCAVFADLLRCAEENYLDRNSVYQAYNYGKGYLYFVASSGGVHTRELAEEYAKEHSGGRKKDYKNPLAVEANGGWRYAYGNMFYAELVDQIMAERKKEMELSALSKILVLLTAAEYLLLTYLQLFRTDSVLTGQMTQLKETELRRKSTAKLVRELGSFYLAAAVLLLYGATLAGRPAEFCGAVLTGLTGAAVYGAAVSHPLVLVQRGFLPVLALISILSRSAF